jgi:uncharacterized protein
MQTTSSETSRAPSSARSSPIGLALWLALAVIFATVAFVQGRPERNLLYDYGFAAAAAVNWLLLVGLTVGIAYAYERPPAALGLRSFRPRWVGSAFGVVVGSLVLSAALEPFLHGGREQGLEPTSWQPEHAGAFAANAALVVVFGPFAEELFYRGLGVRALVPLGGVVAVVVSALAFGLAHGVVAALPPLAVFGAGLAWIRLRSESVWPGVIAHMAYNGLALAVTMAFL